ncbi:MAG: hypothetical protein DLM63_01905 [Solirubrobacterales bacterium]|nr:MAG: hypothetical protein DLM63_01905 [Solirubrobacterales bacterium]
MTVTQYEHSRRELARSGLAIGTGALSASAGRLLWGVGDAVAAAPSGDAGILSAALGLEQVAVFSYRVAAASSVLAGPFRALALKLAGQEQEHADALAKALGSFGATAPPKPATSADVDRAVAAFGITKGLSKLKSQADIATYAIELEATALGIYHDAHKRLQNAALVMMASQIMCNEGQHLVLLRSALQQNPVPNAFETGKATR